MGTFSNRALNLSIMGYFLGYIMGTYLRSNGQFYGHLFEHYGILIGYIMGTYLRSNGQFYGHL